MSAEEIGKIDFIASSSGAVEERCLELPPVGSGAEQSCVRQETTLTREMLTGTRDLFVFAKVRVADPVPALLGLWLGSSSKSDASIQRLAAGLRCFRLEQSDPFDLGLVADADLVGLGVLDQSVQGWPSLESKLSSASVKNLRLFAVDVRMSGVLPDTSHLRPERLTVRARKTPRGLRSLCSVPDLHSIQMLDFRLPNLQSLSGARNLKELEIMGPGSWTGIDNLLEVTDLKVHGRTIPSARGLRALPSLRYLSLRLQQPPDDIDELGQLRTLRRLELDFGGGTSTRPVLLGFLRSLGALEAVTLTGFQIDRGDVEALLELPKLKKVEMFGNLDHIDGDDLRKLRERSSVSVQSWKSVAGVNPALVNGEWMVFADLATEFSVNTNYDAENLVRNEVARINGRVVPEITFDSEAGAFSASSNSREAIEIVATAIRTLQQSARGHLKQVRTAESQQDLSRGTTSAQRIRKRRR